MRRMMPAMPRRPEPNNANVPGSGIGTLVLMFPLEMPAEVPNGYEPETVNVVSAPEFVPLQMLQPGKRTAERAELIAPESGPLRVKEVVPFANQLVVPLNEPE